MLECENTFTKMVKVLQKNVFKVTSDFPGTKSNYLLLISLFTMMDTIEDLGVFIV